ncbi:MAG: hypothetical protein DRG39_06870 [Deltaproteobacteria bacterium]|nr:MAG: hypothetical protein DRG39_06870 [Deltaproteobacteria bacterium]
MIRINLLPFRVERKKENIRRQLSIYLLSIAFLLLLSFYINQSLSHKITRLESIRSAKRNELAKYEKINRKIRKIKKRIEEYQAKLNVIKNIAQSRLEPVITLDEMVRAIPPDSLWLNSLRFDGRKLRLDGSAKDNDTIALFMTRLKRMPRINNVELRVTKLIKLPNYNVNVCNFNIECATIVPKPKKVSAKPKRRRKKK